MATKATSRAKAAKASQAPLFYETGDHEAHPASPTNAAARRPARDRIDGIDRFD